MAPKMCVIMIVMVLLIMESRLKACCGMKTNETNKDCIIKCDQDDYQCQTHCYNVCETPTPSALVGEEPIVPEQGKTAICYKNCSIKCGTDADCLVPCVKKCPRTTTLY
ncbi:unnamed protein product [Thlaspi arvense]|uniref:Uncharacterized protein n=1 Tax=Thlaspi arvense TaxID=13288 RepID=A0AAU9STE2_THLAR|nr:unnamed protein product [Thlaspi arvense]